MSLDQNLFTLNVVPDPANPSITDLVGSTGTIHYRKQRIGGAVYKINISDPLSGAVLASATAPDATSKTKIIELFNPSHALELKSIGTLSFRWTFKWEDHEFEWKREECYMVRKPDPSVLVAVTKEPPGRLRTTAIQILDYNLNRFDIADRKGLEVTLLTALLTFHDLNEAHNRDGRPPEYTPPSSVGSTTSTPPVPPPKPPPSMGADRIAEIQAARGEVNEVTVSDECAVGDYAAYAAKLLEDEAMLFISIRSDTSASVPKVLSIVEETKRLRHKQGAQDDLHQYVVYDTKPVHRGRIVLDDPAPGAAAREYSPPDSLTVHLSKIDMPELKPKGAVKGSSKSTPPRARAPSPVSPPQSAPPAPSRSEKEKAEKSSLSSRLLRSRSPRAVSAQTSPPPPPLPLGTRPSMPYPEATYSAEPQPGAKPAPSPAQLTNPLLFIAEPQKPPPRGFWGSVRR